MTRTLLLMRHAQAEDFAPGRTDDQRRLTPHGLSLAQGAGDYLREQGAVVDRVLVSSSVRTRETAEQMGFTDVVASPALYNASAETILDTIAETFTDDHHTVLVIGHAPGIPALVHNLIDREKSSPALFEKIAGRFPTCTLVRIDIDGDWSDPKPGVLRAVRIVD